MKVQEILEAFNFVEKEDLQVWPEKCLEQLDRKNIDKILAYLENGPVSGEELFVLDLPAFLYPADQFKQLWEALVKEYGKNLARDISEEEITPSDEFPRLQKRSGKPVKGKR